MENADYCDDIKRLIMSMLQTDSVNRPNAKLVFDSISFALIDMMTEFKFKVKNNLTTIHKP
jgi:hypothetical protein